MIPLFASATEFLDSRLPSLEDFASLDAASQRFACLYQGVNADGMIGHVVVDVGVHLSRRVQGENGRFVELQERESELEQKRRACAVVFATIVGHFRHGWCYGCRGRAEIERRHFDRQVFGLSQDLRNSVGTVQTQANGIGLVRPKKRHPKGFVTHITSQTR